MDYTKFLVDDTYLIDYVVYRFKNKINGKVYIGQTTQPLRKRVIQHMTNSRPTTRAHKTYFHNALNKYGIENFELTILERCSNLEELNEREIYWIAYYKSTNKDFGYNIEFGGASGGLNKKLSEAHRKALLSANLGKHRSEKVKQSIRFAHKRLWKDPVFREKHIQNIMKVAGKNKKPVYQYTPSGEFVTKWDSIADVSLYLYGKKRSTSIKRNIINNNLKNKLGFMKKGYVWSFFSPEERRGHQRT